MTARRIPMSHGPRRASRPDDGRLAPGPAEVAGGAPAVPGDPRRRRSWSSAAGRPCGTLGPAAAGRVRRGPARGRSRPTPNTSARWTPASSPTGRASARSATWPSSAARRATPPPCPTASSPGCSSRPTASSSPASARRRSSYRPLAREVEAVGVLAGGRLGGRPRGRGVRGRRALARRGPGGRVIAAGRCPGRRPVRGRRSPRLEVRRRAAPGPCGRSPTPAHSPRGRPSRRRRDPRADRRRSSRSARCRPTPPPLRTGEPRAAYACPEHPDVVRDAARPLPARQGPSWSAGRWPTDQRLRWWCPMHPEVDRRPPGRRVPGVRRDEAGARASSRTARRARSWPCPSRPWSTPGRGRSSTSSGCRACSTASRSSLGPRCGDVVPGRPGPGAGPEGGDGGGLPDRRRDRG